MSAKNHPKNHPSKHAKNVPSKKIIQGRRLTLNLSAALKVLATVPAVKAATHTALSKRKNPDRGEISYVVRALLAAKAGTTVNKVGEGQNLGNPPPLGLDRTAFMTLLAPLNAVLDNYEGSDSLKASELGALYDGKKKVRHLVDLIHAKAQDQNQQ